MLESIDTEWGAQGDEEIVMRKRSIAEQCNRFSNQGPMPGELLVGDRGAFRVVGQQRESHPPGHGVQIDLSHEGTGVQRRIAQGGQRDGRECRPVCRRSGVRRQ
jgi:hypothetical protein